MTYKLKHLAMVLPIVLAGVVQADTVYRLLYNDNQNWMIALIGAVSFESMLIGFALTAGTGKGIVNHVPEVLTVLYAVLASLVVHNNAMFGEYAWIVFTGFPALLGLYLMKIRSILPIVPKEAPEPIAEQSQEETIVPTVSRSTLWRQRKKNELAKNISSD